MLESGDLRTAHHLHFIQSSSLNVSFRTIDQLSKLGTEGSLEIRCTAELQLALERSILSGLRFALSQSWSLLGLSVERAQHGQESPIRAFPEGGERENAVCAVPQAGVMCLRPQTHQMTQRKIISIN